MKKKKQDITKLSSVEVYKIVLEGRQRKRFPRDFWNNDNSKENAKEITKHLIEKILKLSDEELKENISYKEFKNNCLYGMVKILFEDSIFKAIDNAYPGKYKITDFKKIINYK